MNIWLSLNRINRHGASCALFMAILMFCVASHSVAASMIALLSDIPASQLPSTIMRNVLGIQFVDTNWCFPLVYLLLFLATLIYMELRSTPRWAVWVSFVLLSLPAVAYMAICLRVGIGS